MAVPVREAIDSEDNAVYVSAVSAMEIATKVRLGKLPGAALLARAFEAETEAVGFRPLEISLRHARLAGNLDIPHKDPFDRLLIAQAMIEDMVLVSNERGFDAYGVQRLW
jgi:PIN domain nuclease of toxin-antitoxin system